jgi:hypothetical protein
MSCIKERPILFSGAMVRAISNGSKSQTRRVIKLRLNNNGSYLHAGNHDLAHKQIVEFREQNGRWFGLSGYTTLASAVCPYGNVGDRLWVRECFAFNGCMANAKLSDFIDSEYVLKEHLVYRANADGYDEAVQGWRPSIHMPRWASRINIEITGIRVERLQDISEADALEEGVTFSVPVKPGRAERMARDAYADLWESINSHGSWDANPWVWVIEFRRLA